MTTEPFAYGIQAPIGSVTPLFHKLKDAEDYVAKLTDSRDEAKIIPLYRASSVVESVLETMKKISTRGDELEFEVLRLQEAIRRLAEQDATLSVCEGNVTVTMDATLTDMEREALETAERCLVWQSAVEAEGERRDDRPPHKSIERAQDAATLRGLLERLGGGECTA